MSNLNPVDCSSALSSPRRAPYPSTVVLGGYSAYRTYSR